MKVATLTLVTTLLLGLGAVLIPALLLARYTATDVRVSGELTVAARRDVQATLASMRLDLTSGPRVKSLLDAEPWVHHTNVRISWPDRMDVEVVAQRAIALWNADEFLNEAGEAFTSPWYDRKLPQLRGPGEQAGEVMAQYRELTGMLAETGQTIEVLTLDDVGRWEFESSSGMRGLLGRAETFARMRRLVRVMASEQFSSRSGDVSLIDARYAHGLAVRYESAHGSLERSADRRATNNTNTNREMSL